ncbi:MAG TPA: gamma-glutamyltransferase [Rubricoccaceae bacterium]|jgi:gamma-glutamyltranspeptidase/glutathione hydrolase
MRRLLTVLVLAVTLGAAPAPPFGASASRPTANARAGVTSGHPEATAVGVAILREGGNAVDAAVATAFALAAVLPDAGNLGGGGFLVLRRADATATSWDFRETAPAAATRGLFLGPDGLPIPERSTKGHLAAGVPGSVAGLIAAHESGGRLPLARLVEPAIRLARGHTLTFRTANLLNRYRGDFDDFDAARQLYVRDELWQAGDRFENPDLVRTLERIRDGGRDGFYRGETARLLAAEMRRGGGIITEADLAAYRPVERPVLGGLYRGYRILTMPPPSSGGIALLQTLAALEPYPIAAWGSQSPRALHAFGEALRRAFADRARYVGDPSFVTVPVAGLVDPAYARARMASFDLLRATPSADIAAGEPAGHEHTETTHLSVVDAEGNAVSLTTTLNDYFGARVVVGGAGFLLNDEMDDFATAPGMPNAWGLVQGEVNAVGPGRRMASSMTPVIVEDAAGRLFFVGGSPGGPRIISTVAQVLLGVIDDGLDVQAAASRPRVHHQWWPDVLYAEAGVPETTLAALTDLGWTVEATDRFGAANCILIRTAPDGTRTMTASADPRRSDDNARVF